MSSTLNSDINKKKYNFSTTTTDSSSKMTTTLGDPMMDTSAMNRTRASRSGSGFTEDLCDTERCEEDKYGLINVVVGDVLINRYEVLGLAGQGTFGTVLDVYDRKRKMRLAVKVVRAVKKYTESAQIEVDIIDQLQLFDRYNESLVVKLYKTFVVNWKGQSHSCLAFEKLGRSLYDFMKKNQLRGFRLCDVRHFAFQLLLALAYCHNVGLVHTDLKPENILLCNSDYYISGLGNPSHVTSLCPPSVTFDDQYRIPVIPKIKLIDFGASVFPHHHHSSVICTRQYRAPEVLLKLPWSYPSDVWSAACILIELFTGELLFSVHDDLEHLAMIEKTLERPCPEDLLGVAVKDLEEKEEKEREKKREREERERNRDLRQRNRDRDRDRYRDSERGRDRDRDRDYRAQTSSDRYNHDKGEVEGEDGKEVDIYSLPRHRRTGRESHSYRYDIECEQFRREYLEKQGKQPIKHLKTMKTTNILKNTSNSLLSPSSSYFNPVFEKDYSARDWREVRQRSRSTMRVDGLVRFDNHQLRWPENAIDTSSVKAVRRARTLKGWVFSACSAENNAVEADIIAKRLIESNKLREELVEIIHEADTSFVLPSETERPPNHEEKDGNKSNSNQVRPTSTSPPRCVHPSSSSSSIPSDFPTSFLHKIVAEAHGLSTTALNDDNSNVRVTHSDCFIGHSSSNSNDQEPLPHNDCMTLELVVQDTQDSETNHNPVLHELLEFYDLLCQMLQYDPEKRISARKALFHPFFARNRAMYKPPKFLNNNIPLIDHVEVREKFRKEQLNYLEAKKKQ